MSLLHLLHRLHRLHLHHSYRLAISRRRCAEVIEWKKAYGKYKPLKTPAKCTGCHARIIMSAYHQLCEGCLRNKNVSRAASNPPSLPRILAH